ncbi:DMT family transporter [Streptomyces sparsogenes]|uniref:Integral membrane protein n=1 Tax=Streptomyces sparsogenes DSM 40356 TaxID=1331668 RepID=A0A1R1S7P4_9ACTN|nr:DMT family transporter [Streptomyces sparsogenes]OMI34304.1 integral membrane protein [Streptomyces sparsogenes DSM 40356]
MTSLALSVLLALASAVCYAAGAILQEHVAATTPPRPYAALRRGRWWTAVVLNGTGAVLHVLALAYGPLSVVQPLGALTIVFALPMAAVFVRRPVGAAGWRGAVLATAGLAGLLSLSGSSGSRSLADQERVAVAVVTVSAIAVLAVAARCSRRPGVRSVLLAAAAGAAFGVSSVFTKNVTVELEWDAWASGLPSLAMIGLLAGAGVLLSQASYRGAGLASPLATATVVNPVVATAVGVTALGEHFRHGAPGALLAVVAALVAGTGLVMLTVHGVEASAKAASPADTADRMNAGDAVQQVDGAAGPAAGRPDGTDGTDRTDGIDERDRRGGPGGGAAEPDGGAGGAGADVGRPPRLVPRIPRPARGADDRLPRGRRSSRRRRSPDQRRSVRGEPVLQDRP